MTAEPGRYNYDRLDRVMHEKARLGIMTSLMTHPKGLSFNDLKDLCALTDGNLSRHLDVLREAGLIAVHKDFHDRRPQTTVALSEAGRRKFLEYLEELHRVIQDAGPVPMPARPANSAQSSPAPGLATT